MSIQFICGLTSLHLRYFFEKLFSFKGQLSLSKFWYRYLIVISSISFLNIFFSFIYTRAWIFTDQTMKCFNGYCDHTDIIIPVMFWESVFNAYFILSICRRRVRDMGNDSFLTIIFFILLFLLTYIVVFTSLGLLVEGWWILFLEDGITETTFWFVLR